MARKKSANRQGDIPTEEDRPTQSANGAKPRKRNRKRHAEPEPTPAAPTSADPPGYEYGNSRVGGGRLASNVIQRPPEWFVADLILKRALTFVVGNPSTGKSTFGAWLCSQARRPCIIPGYEESVDSALVPRLATNGVNLERTLILDDRMWIFPHDAQRIGDILASYQADLLWIDPIDSYLSIQGENDHSGVRYGLESLAQLAMRLSLAVVCARHPGKQPGNVCPGSRQWLAVPREIVELRRDMGPPERRALRLRKDPHNVSTGPREFLLEGPRGQPRRLLLSEPISEEDADAMGVLTPEERYLVEEAMQVLIALLSDGEQLASWCYSECEKLKLRERTVREARRRLGVIKRREGCGQNHRMFWELPHSGRPAE